MRRNSFSAVLTLAAVAMCLLAGTASADLVTELGILDLTANGGNNPATGNPWGAGDTYRFAFTSSGLTTATSPDINYYNTFVQNLANASPLNVGAAQGATWKAIASTASVDARDNTSTNIAVNGSGEAIYLLDGTTIVATDYAHLWGSGGPSVGLPDGHTNAINKTELLTTPSNAGTTWGDVWTGTHRYAYPDSNYGTEDATGAGPLGDPDRDAERGLWPATSGTHWIWRWGGPTDYELPIYALSDPLTVTDDSAGGGAVAIAGTDFSNTPVFNAPGGSSNLDNANIDDLNLSDNITVTNWAFAGGGGFEGWDGNAQNGMANSPVTKLNGGGSHAQPGVGDDPPTFNEASFSIDIPDDTIVDLTTVTWDWRAATDGTNQRWLAFRTSLDDTLVFSELALARNAVDSQIITLDDPMYKNLTDQSVSFYWYASGQGSGDIDIDTIIVNGEIRDAAAIPEPGTFALAALGLLGLAWFGRRRRRLS